MLNIEQVFESVVVFMTMVIIVAVLIKCAILKDAKLFFNYIH